MAFRALAASTHALTASETGTERRHRVDPDGNFDRDAPQMAQDWPGLKGMDLAKTVTRAKDEDWSESTWTLASINTALMMTLTSMWLPLIMV